MAIKVNKPNFTDSLSNIIEMWSNIDQKHKNKEDREVMQYSNTIATLDNSIDTVQTQSSINNLLNIINENSNKFNKYEQTSIASNVILNKVNNKRDMFNDYKYQMDEAKKMYFGYETAGDYPSKVKGISQLTGDDIKDWSMEHIAKELNRVDDFNAVLYEDFEGKTPTKFRYNPGGISDKQLIDRMGDYKGQLTAGLEALRGDNKINDQELYYILTNNKEGLSEARRENVRASTTQINKINTATGTIKKNIAMLQTYQAKQEIKDKKNISNPLLQSITLLGDTGIDYDKQWEAEYNALPEEERDISLDEFIRVKQEEMSLIGPKELIGQWADEIASLERKKRLAMQNYQNWSGYPYEAKTSIMGEAYEDDFNKFINKVEEFGESYDIDAKQIISKINPEDMPNDIVWDDDKQMYYSQKENKYYTKKSIEDNL